jgi:hypothetical protein
MPNLVHIFLLEIFMEQEIALLLQNRASLPRHIYLLHVFMSLLIFRPCPEHLNRLYKTLAWPKVYLNDFISFNLVFATT